MDKIVEVIPKLVRPRLTLPDEESAALRVAYEKADVILEYGSGGSTVLAAESAGKHITSVESDREWAQMIKDWFVENPCAKGTEVNITWVDIGPTKAWGRPQDDTQWRRYANYPLGIWAKESFRHPDVVFVDGRFRVGCALATDFNIKRPVTLLFDDYVDRFRLKKVESFIGMPKMVGRMAIFEVEPTVIPPDRLLQIIEIMKHP